MGSPQPYPLLPPTWEQRVPPPPPPSPQTLTWEQRVGRRDPKGDVATRVAWGVKHADLCGGGLARGVKHTDLNGKSTGWWGVRVWGGEGRPVGQGGSGGRGVGSSRNSSYLMAAERKRVTVADEPVDAGDARRICSGPDDLKASMPTLHGRREWREVPLVNE